MVSSIPNRHTNINPASHAQFLANPVSRETCSQIPDPVYIFIVFPIPAPYFGQIPNPENTLPDPEPKVFFAALSFKEKINTIKEHGSLMPLRTGCCILSCNHPSVYIAYFSFPGNMYNNNYYDYKRFTLQI